MKKLLLAAMLVLATLVAADAQSIVLAQYDFENPTLASTDADSSTTASAFQLGAGISTFTIHHVGDTSSVPFATSAATGDTNSTGDSGLFASSQVNQATQAGALTNNDYFFFTIAPTAGVTFSLDQLQFKLSASGMDFSEGYFVRSSVTGSTNLAAGTFTDARTTDGVFNLVSADLSGIAAMQDVAAAVEFRIYFYNPDGNAPSDSNRIDKVQLTAIAVVPEPSGWAAIGGCCLFFIGFHYFRRGRALRTDNGSTPQSL